jgi:energy-coupling factor transport system permease protein
VSYLRRPSPLHATRASIGAAYCAALVLAALLLNHPLALAAIAAAVAIAAIGADVGKRVLYSLRFSIPMLVLVVVVNGLVYHGGLTVLARFGDWGPLGEVDPTLESLTSGANIGFELAVIIAACALASAAVNPDELLRSLRRVSFRSALTATLATRMVPLLAIDAQRIGEAQRSRPNGASRATVMRAITANALDRALDVAATLEVRGYAGARKPPRNTLALSRHDLAFAASAAAIALISIYAAIANLVPFDFYPTISGSVGATPLALSALLIVIAVAPFAQRSGVQR